MRAPASSVAMNEVLGYLKKKNPIHSANKQPSTTATPNFPLASGILLNPCLALPDKFDVKLARCKGFFLQCSILITQQLMAFPMEE